MVTNAVSQASIASLCAVLMVPVAEASPAGSGSKPRYHFDIPEQDLNAALQAVALASNHQLLYKLEFTEGLKSHALKANYTVQEALDQLLAESGLTYEITSSAVIMVRREVQPKSASNLRMKLSAMLASLMASIAAAQPAPGGDALEEVVVTATRRNDTVHNIPLSIAAVSNETLEAQGIKSAQDIARIVPSLRITTTAGTSATPFVSIRGIRSSAAGAATTGIYIDDVALQQRTLIALGTGPAFPQMFDLERVEVLRGPQGTLYGGSSEGGTVRFITTQPSFTDYSGYVRGEGSQVEEGGTNYEGGFRFGGPIVEDKLAFSLTAWKRQDAGYIDHISRFTGNVIGEDTNTVEHNLVHLQLGWKPSERSKVTLAYYYSDNLVDDTDLFWFDIPAYSSRVGPATGANPQGTTYNYGPYSYGPYTSNFNTQIGDLFYTSDAEIKPVVSDTYNYMRLPSLTLDFDFDKISVKSVTSFFDYATESHPDFGHATLALTGGTGFVGGFNGLPNTSSLIANLPLYASKFDTRGRVETWAEELRFASTDSDARLSWVAGIYYSDTSMDTNGQLNANFFTDAVNAIRFGISTRSPQAMVMLTDQTATETQLAGFGEATYKITDKLLLTGGLRYTRNEFTFHLLQAGAFFGLGNTLETVAQGTIEEDPVTPKVGLQYILNENTNFYINAAEGFRPGGVNQALGPICDAALAVAGYPSGAPLTFKSDSLWSYELGAKTRGWNGRAALNGSIFYIDWSDVQTQISPGCGLSFTANASKVVSKGFDLDGSIRVLSNLTLSASLTYIDAKNEGDVRVSPTTILIGDGDPVTFTPEWTGSVSALFDFNLGSLPFYIRGDYQFQSSFEQGQGPTTAVYLPDLTHVPPAEFMSARAGVTINKIDVSVFVDNLTGSTDLLAKSGPSGVTGRAQCIDLPACTNYRKYIPLGNGFTYRPRTWGVSASYRF